MKISVEDITYNRKKLTVSVDAAEVDRAQRKVLGQFSRQVRIPGFRPGKAPANLIMRRYGRDVAEELERELKSEAYREIVEEDELRVSALLELDAGDIQAGQPAQITFVVDMEPEVNLPDYEGIAVIVPATKVTKEDVNNVLYSMRSQMAEYNIKDGPAQESDYVQVTYEGKLEDGSLEELAPDTPALTRQSQTWEEASAERGDFPQLAKQLIGLSVGEEKEITVDFDEDFKLEALRGKSVQYAVKVYEVREKVMPTDEDFLKAHGADSIDALQEFIRNDLVQRMENEKQGDLRDQVIHFLLGNTEFDLPESEVEKESELMYQSLLERHQSSPGKAEEDAEAFEARLWEDAVGEGRRRVQLNWIIRKIAEKEGLQPETEDMQNYILREAFQTQQRPEKVAKELQKDRDRLRGVQEFILFNKTLDFLVKKSTVTENLEIPE